MNEYAKWRGCLARQKYFEALGVIHDLEDLLRKLYDDLSRRVGDPYDSKPECPDDPDVRARLSECMQKYQLTRRLFDVRRVLDRVGEVLHPWHEVREEARKAQGVTMAQILLEGAAVRNDPPEGLLAHTAEGVVDMSKPPTERYGDQYVMPCGPGDGPIIDLTKPVRLEIGPAIGHTAGLHRIQLFEEKRPWCGVVLAGGKGTRMGELTKVTNKHLLPVGPEPMVYGPLRKLVHAGVTNIMLVTGTEHMGDFVNLLGSGRNFPGGGCSITYRVQDEAGGIAQALALAESFCCGRGRPVVILGDNVFEDDLLDRLAVAAEVPDQAYVMLKKVPDPQRYGVAYLGYPDNKTQKILSLHEKPETLLEGANYRAVTGVYVYPSDVFDVIRTLKPSARGELEITDVNEYYRKADRLSFFELSGYWTDAGTLPSWAEANRLVTEKPPR